MIKSEFSIGKTRLEVIALLGDDSYDENHISNDLGFAPGLFNMAPDMLGIYFENGKVIKVEQHEA